VKAASAVEPDVVDVATVPTSARPITISSRTKSIFIFLRHEASGHVNIFAIYMNMSMVTKGCRNFPEGKFPSVVVKVEHQGDDPCGRQGSVADPVRGCVESNGRVEDEAPDRRGIVRSAPPVGRKERELDHDCERKHFPLHPADDEEKVGEEVLRAVEAEEEGQL